MFRNYIVNMKFHSISAASYPDAALQSEYKSAKQTGTVRVGDTVLFFRSGLMTCYVPYQDVAGCFRRVYQVPVKMCCGRGEIEYEHLVIRNGEKEIADIPLPGTKAAQELILLLKEKMPAEERGEESVAPGQAQAAGEGA